MRDALLAFILFTGSISISFAQDWTTKMDSVLQALAKDGFFDGQVLIAEKGNALFNHSYGAQIINGKERLITGDTPLPVFSVGKSFTALAIMLLENQGLITFDDKLRNFFPELPYQGVTIRHLLTMTSGLPRFLETALRHGDTTAIISNPGIIELIAKHQPGGGQPGKKFEYNNANYILLASIVERVSGMEFAVFLDQHIFEPLEMNQTYETIPAELDSLTGRPSDADHFFRPYGTGTVATTATDLFRYDQALYREQLISRQQLNAAFQCVELNDGSYSNYGFGWRTVDCDTLKEVYHVGDGANMRSSFQRWAGNEKTLIYLHAQSNIYHESVYRLVRNIWEGLPYELPEKRVEHDIDPEWYEKYTGSYLSDFGLVHISTANGRLYLRPDAIPGREELIPSSDTTFYFRNQNLHWEFYLNEENEVIGFGLKGDPDNMGIKQ